jgi:hypothetical protein
VALEEAPFANMSETFRDRNLRQSRLVKHPYGESIQIATLEIRSRESFADLKNVILDCADQRRGLK